MFTCAQDSLRNLLYQILHLVEEAFSPQRVTSLDKLESLQVHLTSERLRLRTRQHSFSLGSRDRGRNKGSLTGFKRCFLQGPVWKQLQNRSGSSRGQTESLSGLDTGRPSGSSGSEAGPAAEAGEPWSGRVALLLLICERLPLGPS